MQDEPIYLDCNSTTPVDPRVVDAMLPYLCAHFGNPSNTYHYGAEPRQALASARDQLARLLGTTADEITFTGSGSKANTLAIRGAALAHARSERPRHRVARTSSKSYARTARPQLGPGDAREGAPRRLTRANCRRGPRGTPAGTSRS
ncbi:MAG: aminotransferase class V-fold PLP-dependent enzyme [Streptosporangiales bacterium]|nr:aminotransferase class V-fold PLP-dependent enzyme [Streptosporangiales bacterium]